MKKVFNFLASGFGVSLLPAAILKGRKNTGAGLLGTAVAVPLAYFFMPESWLLQTVFVLAFCFFAVWVTGKATFSGHDNPKIVIDEIAGFFVAVMLLPRVWPVWLAAFILFRFFDTVKPWFVKKFDRMNTPAGVVLDDVASGFLANVCVQLFLLAVLLGYMFFGPQNGGPY